MNTKNLDPVSRKRAKRAGRKLARFHRRYPEFAASISGGLASLRDAGRYVRLRAEAGAEDICYFGPGWPNTDRFHA